MVSSVNVYVDAAATMWLRSTLTKLSYNGLQELNVFVVERRSDHFYLIFIQISISVIISHRCNGRIPHNFPFAVLLVSDDASVVTSAIRISGSCAEHFRKNVSGFLSCDTGHFYFYSKSLLF